MASKITEASPDDEAESVDFGLDGKLYQAELPLAEAQALRAALAPFIACARRAKPPRRAKALTKA